MESSDVRASRFDAETPSSVRFEQLSKEREMRRRMYEATPHKLPLVGLCLDMCPEYERYEREVHLDVSPFEMVPGTERPAGLGDHPKIDHGRAVKKYHRPAAGNEAPLPEDVRPAPVLRKTMDYLIGLLDQAWSNGDLSGFAQAQGFVRDRTRSIRQDATLQNLRTCPDSIHVHHLIARFHILSGHRLSELPKTDFDAFQNTEQMRKVLQSLSEFYQDSGKSVEGEGEFRAYYLVTHLEDPDVFRKCFRWGKEVLQSAPVQWALAAGAAFHQGDYIHFFRLLSQPLPGMSPTVHYLCSCLLHSHFIPMRTRAASIICKAYAPNTVFSVAKFASWLAFEDQTELVDFCEATGFGITYGPNGEPVSVVKTSAISEPVGTIRPRTSHRYIESILPPGTTITQIINDSSTGVANVSMSKVAPVVPMVAPKVPLKAPVTLAPTIQKPAFAPVSVQQPPVVVAPTVPQAPLVQKAPLTIPPTVQFPLPTAPITQPLVKKDVGPMAKAVLDSLLSTICMEQVQLISSSVHALCLSKHTQLSVASNALFEAFLDDRILEVSLEALSSTAQHRKGVLDSLQKCVLAALVTAQVNEIVTELAQSAFESTFKDRLKRTVPTSAEDEHLFRAYEEGIRVERPVPAKRRVISFAQPTVKLVQRSPVRIEPLLTSIEQEQKESARFEAYLSSLLNQS